MVGAVYYVGTQVDQNMLLDYLGEPDPVLLAPWPILTAPIQRLTRAEALARPQIMVVSDQIGDPVGLDKSAALSGGFDRSAVFNQINYEALRPAEGEHLVDSNSSPVLFWSPASASSGDLGVSHIGSQADSPESISGEYAKWVRRVQGWVSRRGEKVWGLEQATTRPDLDVDLPFLNSVYALPDALRLLEAGATCR
jgi:hypothetical protein